MTVAVLADPVARRSIEMTMRLRTLLGDHPGTAALKNGSIKSDLSRSTSRVFADQQGLQADGPRGGFRRRGDGDRDLSDGEEF